MPLMGQATALRIVLSLDAFVEERPI